MNYRETTSGRLKLTGEYARYTNADTWYLSWAEDNALYSPWTDGVVNGVKVESSDPQKAQTGRARVTGDDPRELVMTGLTPVNGAASPYGGRYPCASLCVGEMWAVGTYSLGNINGSIEPWIEHDSTFINWGRLGPFVGWDISTDAGKTWMTTSHTPESPLFEKPVGHGIRFGAPHVVDHGKNQEYSPDGYVYMVAHGSNPGIVPSRIAHNSWITGDQVYLLRFKPDLKTMDHHAAYTFYAGKDEMGNDQWSTSIDDCQPILNWPQHCGHATATWFPKRNKYLMCVTDGWPTSQTMDSYFFESDRLTGDWHQVDSWPAFGPQAYFLNVPSKFISDQEDRFWLTCSANYTNESVNIPPTNYTPSPEGMGYGLCLFEVSWS